MSALEVVSYEIMLFTTKCGGGDLEDAGIHFKLRTNQVVLCSFPRLHNRNSNWGFKSKSWELSKTPWIFLIVVPRWRSLSESFYKRKLTNIFFRYTDGCISRDRLSAVFQGTQGQWLCFILFWSGKDKPRLCLKSKTTIWTASGILGHLEAAEHWMLRKHLSKWEKDWDWTLHHPSNESTQWESLKRGNVQKEKSQKEQLYFFRVSPESKSIFVHGRKRNTTS